LKISKKFKKISKEWKKDKKRWLKQFDKKYYRKHKNYLNFQYHLVHAIGDHEYAYCYCPKCDEKMEFLLWVCEKCFRALNES